MKSRIETRGLGEKTSVLCNDLTVPGEPHSLSQEQRLGDVEGAVVSPGGCEFDVAILQLELRGIERLGRLVEEELDLVQAAGTASSWTVCRKDVSASWNF